MILGSQGTQGFQSRFAVLGSSPQELHLRCVRPVASGPNQMLFWTGVDWDMNCTKMWHFPTVPITMGDATWLKSML